MRSAALFAFGSCVFDCLAPNCSLYLFSQHCALGDTSFQRYKMVCSELPLIFNSYPSVGCLLVLQYPIWRRQTKLSKQWVLNLWRPSLSLSLEGLSCVCHIAGSSELQHFQNWRVELAELQPNKGPLHWLQLTCDSFFSFFHVHLLWKWNSAFFSAGHSNRSLVDESVRAYYPDLLSRECLAVWISLGKSTEGKVRGCIISSWRTFCSPEQK